MWSIKSKVEVKGIFCFPRFFQKLEGKIDICDSGVKIRLGDFPGSSVESESGVALEKITSSAEVSPIVLETKVGGLLFKVPLPGHGGEVSYILKDFSRSHGVRESNIACGYAILSGEK